MHKERLDFYRRSDQATQERIYELNAIDDALRGSPVAQVEYFFVIDHLPIASTIFSLTRVIDTVWVFASRHFIAMYRLGGKYLKIDTYQEYIK